MMKLDDIEEVKDEEKVARILFSPYFFKKNGSLSTAAFNLRNLKSGPEKYVSVERLSLVPMSDFVAFAKTLTPPSANKLYGYATLKSGDIRSLLPYVDIKKYPTRTHLSHGGIEYFLDGSERLSGEVSDPFLLSVISDLCEMCVCTEIDS